MCLLKCLCSPHFKYVSMWLHVPKQLPRHCMCLCHCMCPYYHICLSNCMCPSYLHHVFTWLHVSVHHMCPCDHMYPCKHMCLCNYIVHLTACIHVNSYVHETASVNYTCPCDCMCLSDGVCVCVFMSLVSPRRRGRHAEGLEESGVEVKLNFLGRLARRPKVLRRLARRR